MGLSSSVPTSLVEVPQPTEQPRNPTESVSLQHIQVRTHVFCPVSFAIPAAQAPSSTAGIIYASVLSVNTDVLLVCPLFPGRDKLASGSAGSEQLHAR